MRTGSTAEPGQCRWGGSFAAGLGAAAALLSVLLCPAPGLALSASDTLVVPDYGEFRHARSVVSSSCAVRVVEVRDQRMMPLRYVGGYGTSCIGCTRPVMLADSVSRFLERSLALACAPIDSAVPVRLEIEAFSLGAGNGTLALFARVAVFACLDRDTVLVGWIQGIGRKSYQVGLQDQRRDLLNSAVIGIARALASGRLPIDAVARGTPPPAAPAIAHVSWNDR